MDSLIQFLIEYILTNGSLPGFKDRLEATLPFWQTSDESFVVYRGHGHQKKGIQSQEGIPQDTLKNSVRPIVSTSKNKDYIIHKFTDYETKKEGICCLFEISVEPGIRFLDFTSIPNEYLTTYSIKSFMELKKTVDPENAIWPNNKMPLKKLKDALLKRKISEQEILLEGLQGTFVTRENTEETANNGRPMRVKYVSFVPKIGGRRTRKNKHKQTQRKYTLKK
jgi:hypothetical protein